MNKEYIQRAEAWSEFKRIFPVICKKISEVIKQIDLGRIYHSSDFDDKKKSQLVLAFIEKPINVYKKENGGLYVESEWGCRLIYELNYNGSVTSRIRDYDGKVYKLNTHPSASDITEKVIRKHIRKFFLVERNNSKKSQPTFWDKLKFSCFASIQQKSWLEILKIMLSQFPIIKQLVKAISDGR